MKVKGVQPQIYMLSIKASTIQVYDCGDPRARQCGGRLSFQVVSHLSPRCLYAVYIYSVLFLLFYIVHRKKKSFLFLQKEGPLLRGGMTGTSESVMVAYTHKYAKVSVCNQLSIRTVIRSLFYY